LLSSFVLWKLTGCCLVTAVVSLFVDGRCLASGLHATIWSLHYLPIKWNVWNLGLLCASIYPTKILFVILLWLTWTWLFTVVIFIRFMKTDETLPSNGRCFVLCWRPLPCIGPACHSMKSPLSSYKMKCMKFGFVVAYWSHK
jgi:hypothetical protein